MPDYAFPPPKPSNSHTPDLNALGVEGFERLSLDVAKATLKGVRSGDLHELKGVRQHGVDFLVDCGEAGIVVGSCRSDADPPRNRIVSAAKEFAQHWEKKWKPQGVTHFILCLTCEARTAARKNAISDAEQIIESLGLTIETWSRSGFVERLRGLPAIVTHHMSPEWAHRLCAPSVLVSGETSIQQVEALRRQIAAHQASQEPLIRTKVEGLQDLARKGAVSKAVCEAEKLLADLDFWAVASPEQKSIALRTSGLKAWPNNLERLKKLTRRASEVCPPKDRYFDLMLVYHEEGRQAALAALDIPRTARERTFKAALEVEIGKSSVALETLDEGTSDAAEASWRNRVRAIALAKTNRIDEAIEAAEAAVSSEPDNWAAQTARAQLIYNAAVSPALGFLGLSWPEPFPPTFIKQDRESIEWRARAVGFLRDLYARAPEKGERESLSVWLIADLLNSKDGTERASQLYQAALDKNELAPGSVHWMTMRGAHFDMPATVAALKKRIDKDHYDAEAVGALVMLYQDTDDAVAAKTLIDKVADPLRDFVPEQYARMKAIVDTREQSAPGSSMMLMEDADEHQLVSLLADASHDPIMRYEAARSLAQIGVWPPIIDAETFLLDTVATASAFELFVHAKAATDLGAPIVDLIQTQATRFYADNLPYELERIRIEALANAGDLPLAISTAELVFQDPAHQDYLRRAFYLLRTGNGRGAAKIVRDALEMCNPDIQVAQTCMQWAHTLHRDDPELAADLTRHAFDLQPTDAINYGAAFLAMELFPRDADRYIAHMYEVAASNLGGPVRLSDFEETKALLISSIKQAALTNERYERGDVFGHGVMRDQLALHYLTPFLSDAPYGPVSPHISHAVGGTPRDISFGTVVMDITAVLIADALDLWDAIGRARWNIALPDGVTTALLEMERKSAPSQPDRRKARQHVLALQKAKQIRVVKYRPTGSFCIRFADDVQQSSDISEHDLTSDHIAVCKDTKPAIFIDEGVAESIAHRGLLQALVDGSRVYISETQFSFLRDQERADENGSKVASQLNRLRTKLASEFRDGRVRQLPAQVTDQENDDIFAYILRGVLSESGHSTVAWIDDRFLNGHSKTLAAPIIGVQTVLKSLVAVGAMDEQTRRRHIRRLRAGGFNHLLPTAEEIVGCFRRINEGDADAQVDLSVARSASNRFALQSESVYGPLGQHVVPEIQAGISQFMLADRIIQLILEDSLGSKSHDAKAIAWTIDHFRLDSRPGVPAETSLLLAETWFSSIILAFLSKVGIRGSENSQDVSDLFSHIFDTRILPALHNQPNALQRVYNRVRQTLAGFLLDDPSADEDPDYLAARVLLVKRFINLSPDPLKSAILADSDVKALVGVAYGVTLGEWFFPENSLWHAIDRLTAGEAPALEASDGIEIELRISADSDLLAIAGDEVIDRFMAPEVFLIDPIERRQRFSARIQQIGLDSVDATALRRRFGQAISARKREQLLEELNQSIEGRLKHLKNKRRGSEVSEEELAPPSLKTVSEWLGFGDNEDRTAQQAFEILADVHGVETAIVRWSGAPIAFPAAASAWFMDLPATESSEVAARLASAAQDPVSNRNLLALFSLRPNLSEQCEVLFQRLEIETTAYRLAQLHFAQAASSAMAAEVAHTDQQKHLGLSGWVWSGRLVSSIGPMGVDLKPLAEFSLERSQADHRALAYRLRAEDLSDPASLTNTQYLSGLANMMVKYAPKAPSAPVLNILKTELVIEEYGGAPHLSCLRWHKRPNTYGVWLGGKPCWVQMLSPDLDPDVLRLTQKPKASVDEAFQTHEIDLFRISTIGARALSRKQVQQLMLQLKTRIPKMKEFELACTQTVLCDLNKLSKQHRIMWRMRMQEALSRWMEMEDDTDIERSEIRLSAFLERALVTALRFDPVPWSNIEADYSHFSRAIRKNHSDEMADFLSAVTLLSPIAERYRFTRLVAQLRVWS